MTNFEEYAELYMLVKGEHNYNVAKCAYLAGQASAETRVDNLIVEVDNLKAKCAEIERELKMTDEFRIKALNDLAELKAQAGEPVAWQHRQRGLKEYEWQEWQTVGYKPQGPESQTFQMRPLFTHPTTEPVKAQAGESVAWMNKRGDVISAEEKTLIIENGKLGYPGGEFDLHAKNIERSYTIPLGVINV